MTVYLDEPLPDEVLFSVIARYVRDGHIGNTTGFLHTLMGSGNVAGTHGRHDYGHLAVETARSWNMNANDIRDRLTLFPFYARLFGAQGVAASWRLAFQCAPWSGCFEPGRPGLRYCDSCWREDDLRGDPRFWRRAHQLPGVVTCPEHQHPLAVVGSTSTRRLLNDAMQFRGGRTTVAAEDHELENWRALAHFARKLLLEKFSWSGFSDRAVRFACATSCGYGAGRDLDFARMSRDLIARFGKGYFRAQGLPVDSAAWVRRAMIASGDRLCNALPTVLVAYLLIDGGKRAAASDDPICPGSRSRRDEMHHVEQRATRNDLPHIFCSCGFSFVYDRTKSGSKGITPTQDGPDIALTAIILNSRGHSIQKIAACLGLRIEDVDRQMTHRTEVRPWHRRTERAKNLALWIELVDLLGDAHAAFARDFRRWRSLGNLAECLPARFIAEK